MAEDFAINTSSPRNACLDGVASSDVCIFIVGDRGGWTSPSGMLVVEEEYQEAKRRHKMLAVYVQNGRRDADAEGLVRTLTGYIDGHFRATFDDCVDLETVLRHKLPPLLAPLDLPMTRTDVLEKMLSDPYAVQNETTMRLVILPERQEEVIDIVTIGTKEFKREVLAIAHERDVGLFEFDYAKSNRLDRNVFIVEEQSAGRYNAGSARRRMELTPEGTVLVDIVVSSSSTSPHDYGDMMNTFFLLRSDVQGALTAAFSFAGKLVEKIDPYKRHQRFQYGVVFTGIGFRSLVERAEKRQGSSMGRELARPLAIESGRLIGRAVLDQPVSEVARILTLLERAIGE